MIKRRMSLMIGFMVAGSITTFASAQPGDRMLERFDADRDGALSAGEIQTMRGTLFDRFDDNGDGVLDAQEQKSLSDRFRRAAAMGAELLPRADTDHDGRLTREEYLQSPRPAMERADTDHDGRLTREEIVAARAVQARAMTCSD